MVTIIFESHSTTLDNQNHISSGHYDVALSSLGEQQAKDLGDRRGNEVFDAIFCSDLQRSYKTAEIAFGSKFPIVRDVRLRECDYGEWTRYPSEKVEAARGSRVTEPFPGGESYRDTAVRMKSFLADLLMQHDGKRVMVIGHRATQYGLEHWVNKVPLEKAVTDPWQWQPGWEYTHNII